MKATVSLNPTIKSIYLIDDERLWQHHNHQNYMYISIDNLVTEIVQLLMRTYNRTKDNLQTLKALRDGIREHCYYRYSRCKGDDHISEGDLSLQILSMERLGGGDGYNNYHTQNDRF